MSRLRSLRRSWPLLGWGGACERAGGNRSERHRPRIRRARQGSMESRGGECRWLMMKSPSRAPRGIPRPDGFVPDNVHVLPGARRVEVSEDAIALAFTREFGDDHALRSSRRALVSVELDALAAARCARGASLMPARSGALRLRQESHLQGVGRPRRRTIRAGRPTARVTSEIWDATRGCSERRRARSTSKTGKMHQPRPSDFITKLSGCNPTAASRIVAALPQRRDPRRRRDDDLSAAGRRLLPHRPHDRARAVLHLRAGRQRQERVPQPARPHPRRLRDERADGHVHELQVQAPTRPTLRCSRARAWSRPRRPRKAAPGRSPASRR
jgi:hypothetical protein